MEEIKIMKLNEYNGNQVINPEHIIFMDSLYEKIQSIIKPLLPEQYKIKYQRGVAIDILTGDSRDTTINVHIDDDKIYYGVKPSEGIDFEFNYKLTKNNDEIVKSIKNQFINDPNRGIFYTDKPNKKVTKSNDEASKTNDGIDIKIIRETLDELVKVGSISLNDTSVGAIILRMMDKSK